MPEPLMSTLDLEEPLAYSSSSYMIDELTGYPITETPNTEEATPTDVDELSKKLGVDLAGLENTPDGSTDVVKDPLEETEEDKKKEPDETEEVIKKRLATVDTELKNLMGVGLVEVYGIIQELTEFKNAYYIERQQNELKSEWGVSYEDNFKAVQEKWESLPQVQKQALNNPDGARLLLALIEKERNTGNTKSGSTGKQTVPQYQKSTAASSSETSMSGKIRYSEILKMSEEDYRKNQTVIEKAFKEGRVIRDY